jgi:hypothetical protein
VAGRETGITIRRRDSRAKARACDSYRWLTSFRCSKSKLMPLRDALASAVACSPE